MQNRSEKNLLNSMFQKLFLTKKYEKVFVQITNTTYNYVNYMLFIHV